MKNKISIVSVCILYICITSCNDNTPNLPKKPIDIKTDNAILLMYKIYSDCTTTILDKKYGKIDTLVKSINYLCLPVKIADITIISDTTTIAVFFEPEQGYEVEDPKCNPAYTIGFIGSDNECDFIEFGDNYYTLTVSQYMKENIYIDSIFNAKISNLDCINARLRNILQNLSNPILRKG